MDSSRAAAGKMEPLSGDNHVAGVQFGGFVNTAAPRFSGEGSFSRFKTDMEGFFTFNPSFTDEYRLGFLPLCLTGVARDAFESLSDDQRGTYSQALAALGEIFAGSSAVDAHAQLQELRLDPRDSLDTFLVKFRKLVSEAFPGNNSDIVLFNNFLAALPEKYRVDIVTQGITTFQAAADRVRNAIRGEKLRDRTVRQVSASEPTVLDQILHRLEQLEKQVSQQGQQRQTDAAGPPRRPNQGGGGGHASDLVARPVRACYACAGTSHVVRNCRHRNATCFTCGQVGHISLACRNGGASGNGRGGPMPGGRQGGPSLGSPL